MYERFYDKLIIILTIVLLILIIGLAILFKNEPHYEIVTSEETHVNEYLLDQPLEIYEVEPMTIEKESIIND